MTTDFCILGAGLAGLSLADALAGAGYSVTVIDKNQPGSGASGTPGGLVNPATGRRATKAWKAEECYKTILQNLKKVQKHSSQSFFYPTGLLRPALLEKMARKMKEQHEKTSWPKEWCQWKTKEEILDIHPGIQCVDGGLWLPIGLSVDVGRYMKAYAGFLRAKDVNLIGNRHPQIQPHNKSWDVELQDQTIHCDQLIYATGHSTGRSPYWSWLSLNLIKGQVARFETSDPPLDFSHSISSLGYMARTNDPRTFIQGSTYEHDFADVKPDKEGEQYLRKRMRRTLPELEKKVTVVDRWAGVRTSTPNYKPILGSHPDHDNLHVFTGLGSKGLLFSKFLANHYVSHLTQDVPLYKEVSIERML